MLDGILKNILHVFQKKSLRSQHLNIAILENRFQVLIIVVRKNEIHLLNLVLLQMKN